jgi:hypothetical protein
MRAAPLRALLCVPPLARASRRAVAAPRRTPHLRHHARVLHPLRSSMTSTGAVATAAALAAAGSASAERLSPTPRDHSSLANPSAVRVTHADLVLAVDFSARRVAGSAALRCRVEALAAHGAPTELVLDTRALSVTSATWQACGDGDDDDAPSAAALPLGFAVDGERGALGSALRIALPAGLPRGARGVVTLTYATSPASSACQWLAPQQARVCSSKRKKRDKAPKR